MNDSHTVKAGSLKKKYGRWRKKVAEVVGLFGLLSICKDLLFLHDIFKWICAKLTAHMDLLVIWIVKFAAGISWLVECYRLVVHSLFKWLPFHVPGPLIDFAITMLLSIRISELLVRKQNKHLSMWVEKEIGFDKQSYVVKANYSQTPSEKLGVVGTATGEFAAKMTWLFKNNSDFRRAAAFILFVRALVFASIAIILSFLFLTDYFYRKHQ